MLSPVWRRYVLATLMCALPACAQEARKKDEVPEAAQPTKSDARKAEGAFRRALRLQSKPAELDNLQHSLEALEESRGLDPNNPTYATTYELVKQQLIAAHLEKGDQFLHQSRYRDAIAEFREVLRLEPANALAQSRLNQALASAAPQPLRRAPVAEDYASEPVLRPTPGQQPFDFRGDSRQLLNTIGKAFGITVLFDDSVTSRTVRFKLDAADFATAMRAAQQLTRTFMIPMSETQVILATDNPDTRRRLERMSAKTYSLPYMSSAQELTEFANLVRTMLDVRFIIQDQAAATITVRAPGDILRAVDSLIEDVTAGRPEVLLEIRAYQLGRSVRRDIGVSLPLQFTIFNVGTEARSLLSQGNNQALIDELIRTGVISAADAAAIAAALAAQGGSVFLQPFAVFGGGKTLSGIVIPNAIIRMDYSRTEASVIQHMTLRASQGSAAIYRIGDRIPVLTSQYAPLINIPGTTPVNTTGIIPSFNYEDLGITLKATPHVSAARDVTLQLELQIKALGGQSFNGVPTISTREYVGTVALKDGESSVVSGSINVQEQNVISGLPWFSRIPLLGRTASTRGKNDVMSELVFVITPHVVRQRRTRDQGTELMMGR